jgi:uncharacterized protein (TIRG00374 family)
MGQMSADDKQHVLDDIGRANYLWVVIPPIIALISNYFRSERWRLLLRPLGYNPGFLNTFLSVMIMYFLNLFFPRLGEVSRCGILARYEKVPLDKAIGTMVLERFVDVICLGVLILILLAAQHDKFLQLWATLYTNSKTQFADIIAKYQIRPEVKNGVTFALLALIIIFLLYQVRKKGWKSIYAGLKNRAIGLFQGLISIKDISSPGMFIFHTVMIWFCYFLMAYLPFFMFPETSGLSLFAGGVLLFAGSVAFSLTPGGLGLSPIFTKIVLGVYGVTGSAGISLGLVTWTVQTVLVLVAGVISLILLAIINREPSLDGNINPVSATSGVNE